MHGILSHRDFSPLIIFKMKEQKTNNRPQKYSKISLKRRQKLVNLVVNKSVSIFKAAKRLSIKNSTAKLIIKRFKESESYFESKRMRDQRIKKEKEQLDRKNESNQIENEAPSSHAAQLSENIQFVFPLSNFCFLNPWCCFPTSASHFFQPLA